MNYKSEHNWPWYLNFLSNIPQSPKNTFNSKFMLLYKENYSYISCAPAEISFIILIQLCCGNDSCGSLRLHSWPDKMIWLKSLYLSNQKPKWPFWPGIFPDLSHNQTCHLPRTPWKCEWLNNHLPVFYILAFSHVDDFCLLSEHLGYIYDLKLILCNLCEKEFNILHHQKFL